MDSNSLLKEVDCLSLTDDPQRRMGGYSVCSVGHPIDSQCKI